MPNVVKDFLFINLEEGSDRAFDGLTVGEFTDMWGRDVAWSPADIAAIATETKLALSARRASEGDGFAGLPIEGKGHFSGDAVGWITDVNLSTDGQTILLTPEWNKDGREILETKKRRYFSPTIAERKDGGTILGGTLTNWPAIRDGQDLPLMKPVALSDGRFTYGSPDDPANANSNLLVQIRDGLTNLTQRLTPMTAPDEDTQEGENDMSDVTKLLEGLTPEAKAEVLTAIVLESGGEVTELIGDEINRQLDGVDGTVAETVQKRVNAELAKRETIAYSKEVVGGALALPVDGEEMEEFLLSLDESQLKSAKKIFGSVLKTGLVSFEEKGNQGGAEGGGTKVLSASMVKVLESKVSQGISLEDFFKVNPDLGDMGDYDLSAFETEE